MNDIAVRRLLVPIAAATERSRGIDYAQRCLASACPVEVCLLHVIEPVDAWEVLRFLRRDEIERFQEQRAADCLARNAAVLAAEGIPFHSVVRRGHLIESIVGVAEEWGCSEIVVPTPSCGLWGWRSGGLAADLVRHGVGPPVTMMH